MFNQAINRCGFTLMEILVGVLIIGILTAVAVPMYKRATLKSTFSTVIPPTQSLAAAQEVFYLNNGEYAESKDELDVTVNDTAQTTVTVSDKKNYKYAVGTHSGVPGAKYLVYQKNSKRFADNIHCEAAKTDADAKWLCEKGLGGTPLTGSINGADFLTYLLSGDAGTDKFIREDCPAGYYDNNGTCTKAQAGYYAEDGEMKLCETGSVSSAGSSSCTPCPVGKYRGGNAASCWTCGVGTYADTEGSTSCKVCPAGMSHTITGATSISACTPCPAGMHKMGGFTECAKCAAGTYADAEGSASCKKCPSGTTNNAAHTDCVPA